MTVREKKDKKRAEASATVERKKARDKQVAARRVARRAFWQKAKNRLKNGKYCFDAGGFYLIPRVEISLSGDGQAALSRLTAAHIGVSEVGVTGGKTRFKIRKKDLYKAIAILDEMCYNYQIGDTFGIGRYMAFLLCRIGLIVGAVCFAVTLNIAYSYIWQVRITGNDILSEEEITSALNAIGIAPGRKKSELNARDVVGAINGLDGIVDTSVEIVGTTLYVRILESTPFDKAEEYGAYVSAYDAVVTRLVVRSGTAKVKIGDAVKAGEVLADGSVYSTADELLYVGKCDCEVYGEVTLYYTVSVSPTAVEYRRTGNVTKKTSIEIFGKKLFVPRSPYQSYETVAVTANYDVLLPIYATTYTYYETEAVEVERDINDVAKKFAAQQAEQSGFTDGRFASEVSVKKAAADMYSIRLMLHGETLISRGDNTAVSDNR